MATLTNQERNTLRRVVRALDMRGNKGAATYDAVVETLLAEVREMLQPTEQFVLHLPDEYAFELNVVWYETRGDKKHLFLQVIEPPPEDPPSHETAQASQNAQS